MRFDYAYSNSSQVVNNAGQTGLSFAPDLNRKPTFFTGELAKGIEFREAISALHDVVISDLRFKPKDKTEYLAWAARQEEIMLGQLLKDIGKSKETILKELTEVQSELNALYNKKSERMRPFNTKKQKYFDYLYKRDYDAWFVLDPIITVHPDEVFFECFSQDESSYGRLSVSYEVFKNIGDFSCGTTNIDYSQALYDEFQKVRSYKTTKFEIDPSGFEVQTTNEDTYKEVKIDLPESWVRGLLQVNSAMTMPMTHIQLHPMDVHNICFILHRYKEIKGPRSLRFKLTPGQPVEIEFDPWGYKIVCQRSEYKGTKEEEIRLWGRRRLYILERLIPITKKFDVYLLGTGMPSFFVADLGNMAFTLGLSGWTANDWSHAGNFDLMAPRAQVDEVSKKHVYSTLQTNWFSTPDDLCKESGMSSDIVLSAMSSYAQAGKAIYDINKQVYRIRELSKDPLPMDKLRFANPREQQATALINSKKVQITEAKTDNEGNLILKGTVGKYNTTLVIDKDERLIKGECSCSFYYQNKLYKGPCEHMLATRMVRPKK